MFDYAATLGHWINRAGFALRAHLRDRLAAQGIALTAEEFSLLMVLWRDGPRGMGELAAITLRDRTTVTRLVDRMVAKDLLRREGSDHDRRAVRIAPTAAGAALEGPVLAVVGALLAEAAAGIAADEAEQARGVLQRMVANLDG